MSNGAVAAVGRLGVWTNRFDRVSADAVRAAAAELDDLGYGAIWFGENTGREAVAQAGLLLAATERIVVASGVQNIRARDPLATIAGQHTLSEAHPGRFLLGIGVGLTTPDEYRRGQHTDSPVAMMADYLDAMGELGQGYRAVRPDTTALVVGALGPHMSALAARRADGVLTSLAPPEHTAETRRVLGPAALVAVEQAVVLDDDPATARPVARAHVARLLRLPQFADHLRRLGTPEEQLADGGSDELLDTLVAWGDVDAVAAHLRRQQEAGADHIALNVLGGDPDTVPMEAWQRLAGLARSSGEGPPRIAIAGHPKLTAETARLVAADMARRLPTADVVGVTSLAPGAETLFADAVLDAGGRLDVVVPAADYRQRALKRPQLPAFDRLLERASSVHNLPYDRLGPEAREAANETLLADCDRLFAVWDGEASDEPGDTASIVERARRAGIPVDRIWPAGAARRA